MRHTPLNNQAAGDIVRHRHTKSSLREVSSVYAHPCSADAISLGFSISTVIAFFDSLFDSNCVHSVFLLKLSRSSQVSQSCRARSIIKHRRAAASVGLERKVRRFLVEESHVVSGASLFAFVVLRYPAPDLSSPWSDRHAAQAAQSDDIDHTFGLRPLGWLRRSDFFWEI